MQLLIALCANVYCFFFLGLGLWQTLCLIVACAAAWYLHRELLVKQADMRSNFFTLLFMLWGSLGVVIGTASLIRFV